MYFRKVTKTLHLHFPDNGARTGFNFFLPFDIIINYYNYYYNLTSSDIIIILFYGVC